MIIYARRFAYRRYIEDGSDLASSAPVIMETSQIAVATHLDVDGVEIGCTLSVTQGIGDYEASFDVTPPLTRTLAEATLQEAFHMMGHDQPINLMRLYRDNEEIAEAVRLFDEAVKAQPRKATKKRQRPVEVTDDPFADN